MIRIFAVDVGGLASVEAERLYVSLPDWRREKLLACRNNKQKILSAGAGYLLAPAFGVFGIDAMSVRVAHDADGKPYLVDHPEIFFSLSHSGSLAMCAVADTPVGCDIQCVSEVLHSEAVARRFFTRREQEQLAACSEFQREFARLWTLKESYVKYLGCGIAKCPLDSFDIIGRPAQLMRDGRLYSSPHFSEYSIAVTRHDGIAELHLAAVCSDEAPGEVEMVRISDE